MRSNQIIQRLTISSPEEFRQLVIDHVKQHLHLQFNQADTLVLRNPYVKLGILLDKMVGNHRIRSIQESERETR